MNLAEFFIKRRVISSLLIAVLLLGGYISFNGLARLEDPEFTIKVALVVTQYPGASPEQVEEEVTAPIENAIQQLQAVERVTSISSAGLSQITVKVFKEYGPNDLPQVWDELRRKVADVTRQLPPGVAVPFVNDDFGDVYGQLLTVYGDGYNFQQLSDYADYLRRELVVVEGVGKVVVAGRQQENVFVEISLAKLSQLGIPIDRIYSILTEQNVVSNAGSIQMQGRSLRFHSTGEFENIVELENLLISGTQQRKLIHLKDVAIISRGYAETPTNVYAHNGRQAIAIGISFRSGSNVVDAGKRIEEKLEQLEYARPYGLETSLVYNQPEQVVAAVDDFIINLIAAIAIVIVVLMIFMGLRMGVIIGFVLLLTVMGTFIFMRIHGLDLQRISLGALIIALGMLVDNAIVVAEGILVGLRKGLSKTQAAINVVTQTKGPLLGATIIAILAFAPIGLSPDSTGEIVGSLFYVLLYSLLLSWFVAITITPFLADILLKEQAPVKEEAYQGVFYLGYKKILRFSIRFKYLSLSIMLIILGLTLYSAKWVSVQFFPPMSTPLYLVDYWSPYGSDINAVYDDVLHLDGKLNQLEGIEQVTSTVGQGALRFLLSYRSERQFSNYAQLIVRAEDESLIPTLIQQTNQLMNDDFPNASFQIKRLEVGAQPEGKVEARFSGPDPEVLRGISAKVQAIYRQQPNAEGIRDDWREPTMLVRPIINEVKARRLGISKAAIDEALLLSFSGKGIGLYREGTQLLPIIVRLPEEERSNIDHLENLTVWSPSNQAYISIGQIVDSFDIQFEDPLINRRDRKRIITVMTDINVLADDTVADFRNRVKDDIEAIPLPKGYALEWGGVYYDSNLALESLAEIVPIGFLLMFIITILLFNSFIQPLILWLILPFSLIGVVFGLLLFDKPLSFMAVLGVLSLVGMLLKNGIVLMDQINLELKSGKVAYQAVFDSSVSRVRPVSMAAITTILGMIPLLADPFFESMAVTIMAGLAIGTILILLAIPVLYSIIYRMPPVNNVN